MNIRRLILGGETSTQWGTCTADAGIDQSVESIAGITTLDGTGSSSELGAISTYLWEIISGNGLAIDTPTASTTDISGTPVVGDTIIRLTVTDSLGNSDSDTMTITLFVGTPLSITNSIPDSNADGTLTFANGQAGEVLDLSYRLLNGNNPDNMTFSGSIMYGTLSYLYPSAVGQITLDGSGNGSSNYNGSGAFFQVEITITGRSTSYPLPVSRQAYIPIY